MPSDERRPGRPRGERPAKKPVCVYLNQAALDWPSANLHRSISLSAFVCEAVDEKIQGITGRAEPSL